MNAFLFRWLLTLAALWVADYLIGGISCRDWQALVIAALVLGALNTLLKPILLLISLPLLVLSLGLFMVVINAILLALTSYLVPGFQVSGFWPAAGGALIISLIHLLAGNKPSVTTRSNIRIQKHQNKSDNDRGSNPPPGKGPVIDI
ncbi:MAG: phage holin family protein [Verrucomicrobiota bacterium]